jgi:hypothetical protein
MVLCIRYVNDNVSCKKLVQIFFWRNESDNATTFFDWIVNSSAK